MLQIKNLTITHIKDNRVLLQDLSFTLNSGDKAAIIGEEGNGKSTLLKLIFDEKIGLSELHQQNAISRQDPHGGALLKKTMHRVKAYKC